MIIEARVAEVLNEYELALDAGAAKGVVPGAEVAVYKTVAIRDPDDRSKVIGRVRRGVVRLRVTEVLQNASIAETYVVVPAPMRNFNAIAMLGALSAFEDRRQRISTEGGSSDYRTAHVGIGSKAAITIPAPASSSEDAKPTEAPARKRASKAKPAEPTQGG